MDFPRHKGARSRTGILWLAPLALGPCLVHGAPPRDPEPVAIVASVSGPAQVETPARPPRTLGLFERLCVGATLRTDPQSIVTVAFANGQRFELRGEADVTVGREGFARARGLVRALTPVPPLHKIPAVRDLGEGRTAALRIRGRVVGVYPRDGAAVLADEAVLHFAVPQEAGLCRVEVEDAAGRSIVRTDSGGSEAVLPKGALAPGGQYTWHVRCPAATGVTLRADASFVTLSKEEAEARAALKAAAQADATALALLAEIDQGLGLLREAREEFRSASAHEPDNAALGIALARLDGWLGDLAR